MILMFVGTAGCGKTTLVKSFGEWLEDRGFSVSYINLDPGLEILPYNASFDVRSIVTISDLMRKLGLGPNGAMIMAARIMEERVDDIVKGLMSRKADYVLIDTPGQMELFVFRGLGPLLASRVKCVSRAVAVHIVDAETIMSTSEYLVIKLLSLIVELRLDIPAVTVINKEDVVDVSRLMSSYRRIKDELRLKYDVLTDLAIDLVDTILKYEKPSRLVTISALKKRGLDRLYDLILESFCVCGDLT
ncbi:MAG: ATP/GTP-binding protein [Candidatus Nezhaarchaeota archaeon]|nr:ATP/GTP-binding protein [Candidatus Nezhaarchaeota archaeon]MCX8142025.1 ATP/GTP-binding protein [Candidatus Nezhaarchaeota archaeon]MDW8050194.1 ATP/GTP-binding protein [Nitrososphaerota archaeon]